MSIDETHYSHNKSVVLKIDVVLLSVAWVLTSNSLNENLMTFHCHFKSYIM